MTRAAPLLAALLALVLLASGAQAQVSAWWLGGDEAPPRPVQASQTIGWWLGNSGEAEAGDTADEPTGPQADDAGGPNYDAWEVFEQRARTAISDPETPNLELETLRNQLAAWRERFLSAQSANRTRIDTIRNQISALGPSPADGESEPEDIANRRAALNEQLATLQAPGIAAEEAYLGADGMIREIDVILRERQANELLELAPSPLVPVNWPPAFAALSDVVTGIWAEVQGNWQSTTSRAAARESLPLTLVLIAIGIGLMWRARHWSEVFALRLMAGTGRRAKRVILSLLVSLGQVVLPFLGMVLLVTAALLTGFVGPRGEALLQPLPTIALVIFAARWLGQQVFARSEEAALLEGLTPERRAEGRFYATLLGVLLGLAGLLTALVPYEGETQTARVVLGFPVLLLGGLILVRLGQILIGAARSEDQGPATPTRDRFLSLIGRAAILLGVVGPALAAIGYYTAGRFMVFPGALSLALMAIVVLLQRIVSDLYALATGRGDDDEESLVPVLVGFALALCALPLFALIWGARVADLTELWTRVREGFVFGETRIAPGDFVTFGLIFAVGFLATRLLQGTLRSSVLPKTKIDIGGQNALVSGVGYLGVFLAAIIAITSAGIDLSSLAIVAGALSVGIGFGLQNIVSNFISGIILLVERPISEGDWIDVNGQMGYVRDISVRSTRIETFDKTDVIVPNSDLISGIVTNYTRGNQTGRIIVHVGVAYGTDTKRVEAVLREVAEAHPLVTLNPKPAILFMGFGADALEFEIRAILRDVNFSLATKSDMNHEIARRFAEEGFEIPFAQRDIWLRNPETLGGTKPEPPPKPEPSEPKEPETEPMHPALLDTPAAPVDGDEGEK